MAGFFLINNVRVGATQLFAGTRIDALAENVATIRAAGGILVDEGNTKVADAAVIARKIRLRGGTPGEMAQLMSAALAEASGNYIGAFANADRPDASQQSPGDWLFNTTVSKPNYTDGTEWFTAGGIPTG